MNWGRCRRRCRGRRWLYSGERKRRLAGLVLLLQRWQELLRSSRQIGERSNRRLNGRARSISDGPGRSHLFFARLVGPAQCFDDSLPLIDKAHQGSQSADIYFGFHYVPRGIGVICMVVMTVIFVVEVGCIRKRAIRSGRKRN